LNTIEPVAVGMLLSSQKPVGNPPATLSLPVHEAPPSPKAIVPESGLPPDDPELDPEEPDPDDDPEPDPEELDPDPGPDPDPEEPEPEPPPDAPPSESFVLAPWLVPAPLLHAMGAPITVEATSAAARGIESR
jgi:hypothetical protein